jgi:hypothetical protein
MRALPILILVGVASVAAADPRVVVMSDADTSVLRVTLASRGADVAVTTPPQGTLRLERAADAQRNARANDAEASVWIDTDDGGPEVCVVSADGRFFRHAPLAGDASPRTFAAIATSLLDELLAPPELPPVNVDVHVDVNSVPPLVEPARLTRPTEMPYARLAPLPGTPAPSIALEAPSPPSSWAHRTLLELGPAVSPVSVGVSAEILLPVTPSFRFGVVAAEHLLLDGVNDMPAGTTLTIGALEARYIGHGSPHLELGLLGGGARADEYDEGGFAAARISVVWEGRTSGVSVSFMPALLFGFIGSHEYLPSYLLSCTWELPL